MFWLLQCLDGESSSGESPVPQVMSIGQFLLSRLCSSRKSSVLRSGFSWVPSLVWCLLHFWWMTSCTYGMPRSACSENSVHRCFLTLHLFYNISPSRIAGVLYSSAYGESNKDIVKYLLYGSGLSPGVCKNIEFSAICQCFSTWSASYSCFRKCSAKIKLSEFGNTPEAFYSKCIFLTISGLEAMPSLTMEESYLL
jgi:hypothetical protein